MDKEFLDIVNKNDIIIGMAPKGHIHGSRMLHRAIHVIMLDSDGNLILQKRAVRNSKFPLKYDLFASGHVIAGEQYEEAAKMMLFEEYGIRGLDIGKLIKMRMEWGGFDNMISVVYSAKYKNGNSTLRGGDESIISVSPEKLKNELSSNPHKFTKHAREILKWYIGLDSDIRIIEVY